MDDINNLNKKIPENFPFKLKEYKFPQENPLSECKCNENHIGGWFIDEKLCDDLKDYFWSKKQLHRIGMVGNFEIHQNVKKSTDLEMIFLHKDQFLKQYKSKWLPRYNFPVILSQHKGALELFITTADIVKIKDVAGLVAAIKSRI